MLGATFNTVLAVFAVAWAGFFALAVFLDFLCLSLSGLTTEAERKAECRRNRL